MNTRTVEIGVGLFVACGMAALFMLAMQVSNLSTLGNDNGYEITASFQNIGGLKVRAPIKSAGVVVGRVADIRFDTETYEAVVTMSLGSQYRFPRDTVAKILTSGLLGEQYIGLEAGGDTKMLANGGKLKLTQSAVVLENLISQFLFSKAAEGKDAAK